MGKLFFSFFFPSPSHKQWVIKLACSIPHIFFYFFFSSILFLLISFLHCFPTLPHPPNTSLSVPCTFCFFPNNSLFSFGSVAAFCRLGLLHPGKRAELLLKLSSYSRLSPLLQHPLFPETRISPWFCFISTVHSYQVQESYQGRGLASFNLGFYDDTLCSFYIIGLIFYPGVYIFHIIQ